MAECTTTKPTAKEMGNMIKNRKTFHPEKEDITAEEIVERIVHDNEVMGLVEHTEVEEGETIIKQLYTILETGVVAASRRVSDYAQKKFRQYRSKEDIERMTHLPDNIIKREGGSFLHVLAREIIEDYVRGKKKRKEELKEMAARSEYSIEGNQFEHFYTAIGEVVAQIYDQQEAINAVTGEKGKVKILTEHLVIDPIFDIGGTVDLVAIFSDGTASIYDWKSMSPYSTYTTGYGAGTKIIQEFIPFGKEEAFRLQIQEYKRILMDRYGVKGVRQTRVVPIHVQYAYKAEDQREAGSFYTKKMSLVQMGEEASIFLKQLPVGFEKTGYRELDKFIQGQLTLIEKLKERQSTIKGDKDKWQALQNRIQTIRRNTTDIILKQNFIGIYSTIQSLIKEFEEKGEQMSREDLDGIREEFKAYSGIVSATTKWLDDYSEKKKGDKKKIEDLIEDSSAPIQRTLDRITDKILEKSVESLEEEYKDDTGELKAQAEEGFFMRTWGRLSEFKHPIFKKFKELKDIAIYKKKEALNLLSKDIEEKQNALFNWGKERGYNRRRTFSILINEKTGNLYSHLSKEFWSERNAAQERGDLKWMQKNYEFKDEEAWKEEYDERLKQQKAYLKSKHKNLETWVAKDGTTILKSVAQLTSAYNRDLKAWMREWNLQVSSRAWLSDRNSFHLKLKDEVAEANFSKEYEYIKSNQPLLEFYELFENYNAQFRDMLGVNYRDLPPNFLANIRREFMERLTDKGFDISGAGREFINSLNVREEDEYLGYRDLQTGELQRKIPKLYMNRFVDEDGNLDIREKSFDLGRILYLFGEMAYNYKYMEEIEAQTMGLKLTLEHTKHVARGTKGQVLKNILGERAELEQGVSGKMYKLFETFTDYYLYGVKHRDKGVTANFFGKHINSTKAILAAKHYFGMKVLGFAVIPGTAAWIAGRTAAYLETKKAIAYTPEHMKNTMLLWAQDRGKYLALSDFFDIHVEQHHYREALKLSAKANVKYLNERALFSPLRKADENIDNHILVSMSQNYGFDTRKGQEGNLRRLVHLPEGTKSIYDSFVLDKETGEITVEGLTQTNYIAFRNAARSVSVGVKGALSEEDTNLANLNIYWNLVMQFKTWMPGLLRERLGSLHFDDAIDAARYGRYRAMLSEMRFSEEELQDGVAFTKWISTIVLPRFSALAFDLATFGYSSKWGLTDKVNKRRAELHYEAWKLKHPDEAKKLKFEDFMEAKTSQIRAGLVEARVVIGFVALLAFMGAEGDDDEPRYMKTWLGRTLYKTLNRAHSEIVFAFTPGELIRLIKNPLPIAGLITDVYKTLKNTIDEGYHAMTGTPDPYDKTPWGYYSTQWIIGMSQLRRLIEMFEQDKKSPY